MALGMFRVLYPSLPRVLLNKEAYFRFSLLEGAQRSAVKLLRGEGDRPRGDGAACLGRGMPDAMGHNGNLRGWDEIYEMDVKS